MVMGTGPAGEALAGHPGIDVLTFTGSVRTGQDPGSLAANITRPILELGGNRRRWSYRGRPSTSGARDPVELLHEQRPGLRRPDPAPGTEGPAWGGG